MRRRQAPIHARQHAGMTGSLGWLPQPVRTHGREYAAGPVVSEQCMGSLYCRSTLMAASTCLCPARVCAHRYDRKSEIVAAACQGTWKTKPTGTHSRWMASWQFVTGNSCCCLFQLLVATACRTITEAVGTVQTQWGLSLTAKM